MGDFNSKYESYYNSIVNKKKNQGEYYNYNFNNSNNRRNIKANPSNQNRVLRRIIQDLCGVLAMFVFVLVCKFVVTPQTTKAYNYCKTIVNKNYDYKKIAQVIKNADIQGNYEDKIINTIDNLKSKVTGDETINGMIKNKFQLPVEGKIVGASKEGIDIGANNKIDVKASYDGMVKQCGEDEVHGKFVVINHGHGLETKYSNLEDITVIKQEKVTKGQVIAKNKKENDNLIHFEILFMGQNKGLEKNLEVK